MIIWLALLGIVMSGGVSGSVSWQNQSSQPAPLPASFDFDKTMRVDYVHTGGAGVGGSAGARSSRQRRPVGREPHATCRHDQPWEVLFEVRDKASDRVLYSRGFASIYGEWETTAEVRGVHRSFHASLRFPWPKQPVRVTLQKRQPDNRFVTIWTADVESSLPLCQRLGSLRSCRIGLERLRKRPGGGKS